MIRNQKPTGRALSMPAGLAMGAAISLGITLLMAAILAWLVNTQRMPWENVGYGIMVALLSASFLGALASFHKIKRQRLLVCVLTGVIYLGMLLSFTALFFGGQYEAVGVTAILILAGSMAAGLLGLRSGEGGKTRKFNKHHR